MKRRYYVVVAVVVLLVGLLLQAPAAALYGWTLARRPDAPVQLYGINGTLFEGSAAQLRRANQPVLNDIAWRWHPWQLLLGRAAFDLRADGAPLQLETALATGLGGTRLGALRASGELRALAAIAGQAFVPVTGALALDLSRLRLEDQWPTAAEGSLRVSGLSWALAREPIVLGDYEAQLSTEDGDLVALISTLGGVLDVAGDARLKNDRSYELALQLRPRPDAPPMVVNLLRSLGAPDPQGYYRLHRSGRVPGP